MMPSLLFLLAPTLTLTAIKLSKKTVKFAMII
jgi:hypothetical protein